MSSRTLAQSKIADRTFPAKVAAVVTPWVRNPAWVALPTITNSDQKFVGLHAVYTDSNFLALSAAGNYTVDWGDGVSENISSGVTAYHQYDYADADLANTNAPVTFQDSGDTVSRTAHGYSNGMQVRFWNIVSTTGLTEAYSYFVISATANTFQVSLTSGGSAVALTTDGTGTLSFYKMAIVTVTPNGGTLTALNLHLKHNQAGLNTYSSGFLDMAIAGASLTSLLIGVATAGVTTQTIRFSDLEQVNLYSNAVTNFSYLFKSCYSFVLIPLLNTAAGTDFSFMFYNCAALQTIPLLNTAAGTNFNNMFSSCSALQTIPLLNTAAGTNFSSMFGSCLSLQSVPLLNMAAGTNFSSLFYSCAALQTIPLLNTAAGTNFSGMFNSCYALQTIPLLNTAAGTNFSSLFSSCVSLQSVPLLNTAAGTDLSSLFSSCNQLSKSDITGCKYSVSYTSCKLSQTAIETINTNLGKAAGAQTLTISSNWGSPTPISLSGTSTAGSTTITMASTTGIVTGMQVTGTGSPLTTALACTLQGTPDTVTATAHGLSNGDLVSFATIVTTTGIATYTPYYVVGAATDTFQVALTAGGAAINLVTNGSGTLLYRATVTTVNTNVSVVLDRKMTGSGTNTFAYRALNTGLALQKGWVVSG